MTKDSAKASSKIAPAELAQVGERKRGVEDVQNYLRQFGYTGEGVELRSGEVDDKTSEALRAFQAFNGLPITGEFDSATKEQMTKARCGLPDMNNGIAFSITCRWDRQRFTFAFNNGTNDTAGQDEFQAVRNAFTTWASIVPLTFTEVNANANPDIEIDWRNANDPDLNMVGSTLAHADFPPGCAVVTNTLPKPIHFDDSEHQWSIGPVINAFDIETVALHEIGHILGLQHSSVTGAVMFPTVAANITLHALQPDDIAAIRSLYGWSPQMRLQDRGTLTSPALAAYGGRLIMAWRGIDQDQGIWWSYYDGTNWSPQMRLQDRGTLTSPALAAYGGRLIMAWRGIDQDQGIWWSYYDGTNWSPQMRLQDRGTLTSPALAAYGGRLIMAWRGIDQDQGIWWSYYDGTNWSPQMRLQDRGTLTSPALSGPPLNNLLIKAWRGIDQDQGIWWSYYNGTNWSPQMRLQDRGTLTSPALATYDDLPVPVVIKAWRGIDQDQGIWMSYYNGTNWSPQMRLQDRGTLTSPALAAYGRGVIKAWRGIDQDQGIWWSQLALR